MAAYYNEIDPYAAQWLRNLIAAGHVAPGDVDERSIVDVRPDDLAGYAQCHFFAGIGGWSLALRLAGWPDNRPVWTGSCPCQPFSTAGRRRGFADERHLWPEWFRLISQRAPAIVFGEQVASATEWIALVKSDLESLGYAFAKRKIAAADIGAPHERQRYWFVADPDPVRELQSQGREPHKRRWLGNGGSDVGHADRSRRADGQGRGQDAEQHGDRAAGHSGSRARAGDFWRIEPAVGRLAHGIPARVAKLRAFGNAIVPQVAAEFIMSSAHPSGVRGGQE